MPYLAGQEDKRTNNRTMIPIPKTMQLPLSGSSENTAFEGCKSTGCMFFILYCVIKISSRACLFQQPKKSPLDLFLNSISTTVLCLAVLLCPVYVHTFYCCCFKSIF